MLAYAEGVASEKFSSNKFIMVVVSSRGELIAFYQRRGYQKTGSIMDYPRSAGAGIPKYTGLKVEILEKRIDITIKRDALDRCSTIHQESL
jgi:hypothetical protein